MSEEIKELHIKTYDEWLKYYKNATKEQVIEDLTRDVQYFADAVKDIGDLQQKVEQLEKENKILKENAEHNDKVVDKVNWENMLLKTTINESITLIKQLKGSARYQRCMYELDYLLDELSKKVINHE